jgi:O-antigen/teichoic acid export membrane protein
MSVTDVPVRVDAAWAFGGVVAMMGFTLLSNAIVARMLVPADIASYYLVSSFVMTVTLVVCLGFDYSLIRFVGAAVAEGHAAAARLRAAFGLRAVAATATLAAALVVMVGSRTVGALFSTAAPLQFRSALALWVMVEAVRVVASEAHRGLGDVRAATLTGHAFRGAFMACLVVATYLGHGQFGLVTAIRLSALASAVTCLLATVSLVARLPRATAGASDVERGTIMVRPSLRIMVTGAAGLLLSQGAVWVARGVLDSRAVALYGASARIALLLEAPLFVMNAALLPRIIRLYTLGDRAKLEFTLRRGASLASVPLLLSVGVLALFGRQIMGLVFGEFFEAAAPILLVLAVGQAVNVAMGSCGVVLSMTGNERAGMFASLGCGALALLLATLLGQGLGILGVAAGASAGLVVRNLSLLALVHRRLGILSCASFSIRLLRAPA